MDKIHRSRIDEIIASMECPKGLQCEKSGFTNLPKVRDLGLTGAVECLGEEAAQCQFAIPFGFGHFCKCPLRVYLSKELQM